jgi:dienelactone hydrolase
MPTLSKTLKIAGFGLWMVLIPRADAAEEEEMRTWTSAVGSTIEARLVETSGRSVKLRTEDGRTLDLRLDQLSEADREYVTDRPEEKGPTEVPGIDARPGVISGPIPCENDGDWSYHLYLPEDFHTGRDWPVWFVMSPGGGSGGGALKRYQEGAERFGCILAVSVESKNGFEESDEAVEAMAADIPARLPIEDGLLFASGFSGGSRMAFLLAERNRDVGGVLACGSGGGIYLSENDFRESRLPRSTYVYSLMGTNCFNRTESFNSHQAYDDDYRLRFFPGGHAWAESPLIAQGMGRVLGEALKRASGDEIAGHRTRFAKAAWELAGELQENEPWEAYHWAKFLAEYPDAGTVASRAATLESSLENDPDVLLALEAEKDIERFAKKFFGGVRVSADRKPNPERREAADEIAEKYEGIAHGEIIRRLGEKS